MAMRFNKSPRMNRNAIILACMATFALGGVGMLKICQATLDREEVELYFAQRDERIERGNEHQMSENVTKGFTQMAFKSDAAIKEHIFKQGLICGSMYGAHVIDKLPQDYSQFYDACQHPVEKDIPQRIAISQPSGKPNQMPFPGLTAKSRR